MSLGESVKVYDTAEPVTAYRWWLVGQNRRGEPRLYSAAFRTAWTAAMEAEPCIVTVERHRAIQVSRSDLYQIAATSSVDCGGPPCKVRPDFTVGHGCGLYAMKTLDHVLMELYHFTISWMSMSGGLPIVIGKVLLGGRIIEHQAGYRAAKAKIATLYEARSDERIWFKPDTLGGFDYTPAYRSCPCGWCRSQADRHHSSPASIAGIPVHADLKELAEFYRTERHGLVISGSKITEVPYVS